MKMEIALKNVMPNPFRHLERYPIQEEKLEALKHSIKDTEYWENIVARDMKDGTIEIAYGHHRMAALRDLYSEGQKFNFIIKNLDDTSMAKIMAHENMEEWGSDAAVEQETIRAIVEGYATGRINLPEPAKVTSKDRLRYAPSFTKGSSVSDDHPYTSAQLESFLGWKTWKIKAALAALEKIESGSIAEGNFRGTTTEQQQKIVTEVNKIDRKAEHKIKAIKAKAVEEEKAYQEAPVEESILNPAVPLLEDKEPENATPDEAEARRLRREAAATKRIADEKARQDRIDKQRAIRDSQVKNQIDQVKAKSSKQAKDVAKALHTGFVDKTIGTRDASRIAAEIIEPSKPTKTAPDISPAAERLGQQLKKYLSADSTMSDKMRKLIKHRKHIDPESKKHLLTNLRELSATALELATKLER